MRLSGFAASDLGGRFKHIIGWSGRRRRARKAAEMMMEALETRVYLSVNAASLLGQMLTPGARFVYSYASGNATETITIVGPATAPTGQSATEWDDHLANSKTTGTQDTTRYSALTSAGLVDFTTATAWTKASGDSGSYDDAFSPPRVELPATLTAGQIYQSNYSDTESSAQGTDLGDYNLSIYVVSNTPQSLTVPAGKFSVYEVVTLKAQSPQAGGGAAYYSADHRFYAPGVGLVKDIVLTGTNADGTAKTGTTTYTVSLTSMVGSQEKLVFNPQPANTQAGEPLPPFRVELHNQNGIDADNTSDVTLSLNVVKGAATAQLSGTTTVAAVNGVATFSDLSIDSDGTYTLTATSPAATGSASSQKFLVSVDHLVFRKQPAPADINAAIPLTVVAYTKANRIDTSFNGHAQLSLNVISGGQNATLGGTTMVSFVNGVATFTVAGAAQIAVPGTFTLTATALREDGVTAVAAVDAGTSKKFTVTGFHLVFTQQPKTGDIKAPLSFSVAVQNVKKKIQTQVSGEIAVSLNTITGVGTGATLSGDTTVVLVNGVATFTPTENDEINEPGTYTLTAVENTLPAAVPAAEGTMHPMGLVLATASATSKQFELKGYHLVILEQPDEANINGPVVFQVALKNAENKIVTDEDPSCRIDAVQWKAKEKNIDSEMTSAAMPLVNGIATFTATPGVRFTFPATYKILIAELTYVGETPDQDNYATYTMGIWSRAFKIHPFHLVFTQQPTFTFINDPITFQVEIEDYKDNLVTTEDGKWITIQIWSPSGATAGYTTPDVMLVDGYATFPDDPPSTINHAGTFQLYATEVSALGTSAVDDVYVKGTRGVFSDYFSVAAG